MKKKFLQLVGIRPNPFGSVIEETKNFQNSEEGKKKLEAVRKAWESDGLVCVEITMPAPDIADF